jgi:hypothetical protein
MIVPSRDAGREDTLRILLSVQHMLCCPFTLSKKMTPPKKDATVRRFLHLSDIHFGQENGGTLVKHESVRDAAISDVKVLAEKRGPASRVLVTGDVSYSGKHDECKPQRTNL